MTLLYCIVLWDSFRCQLEKQTSWNVKIKEQNLVQKAIAHRYILESTISKHGPTDPLQSNQRNVVNPSAGSELVEAGDAGAVSFQKGKLS